MEQDLWRMDAWIKQAQATQKQRIAEFAAQEAKPVETLKKEIWEWITRSLPSEFFEFGGWSVSDIRPITVWWEPIQGLPVGMSPTQIGSDHIDLVGKPNCCWRRTVRGDTPERLGEEVLLAYARGYEYALNNRRQEAKSLVR